MHTLSDTQYRVLTVLRAIEPYGFTAKPLSHASRSTLKATRHAVATLLERGHVASKGRPATITITPKGRSAHSTSYAARKRRETHA